jgi:hypothetical protein
MTFIPEELLSELIQALCLDYRSEQSTPFATSFSCNYQDIHVFCAIYIASSVLAKLVYPRSVLSSVQDIFRRIFLSNCWWQKSDIWSQASYRYTILWVAFLDPSDSYFLFADFVDFYTHWTYMHIFRPIFLSNYWWQRYDIWSQASYRYPISWEAFFDPSDSYFLFAEERGYHRWALDHSSSCLVSKRLKCIFSLKQNIYKYVPSF